MPSEGKQVRNGKAFEYALATQYYNFLHSKGISVDILENRAIAVARGYYEGFSEKEKEQFDNAARNTIDTMIRLEPGLTAQKNEKDTLHISLNEDQAGEGGDVRDVLFQRGKPVWEIGFSAKNNRLYMC